MDNVTMAMEISKYLHDNFNEMPHDIGLKIVNLIKEKSEQVSKSDVNSLLSEVLALKRYDIVEEPINTFDIYNIKYKKNIKEKEEGCFFKVEDIIEIISKHFA